MIIKAIAPTVLKKQALQASELPDNQKVIVEAGKEYKVRTYKTAENGHYSVELDYNAGTWYLWSGHWQLPWEDCEEMSEIFTPANLKAIMPQARAADLETYCDPINRVLADFDMANPVRSAAFIAQVAHESGSLRYKEEIASGSAYEGRKDLGNTRPGDGKRFKGRGLIQLTGRANYRACGLALNLDLENNPELVVQDPYTNAAVAGWYWQSRNINAAADREDFQRVTRLINGGLNGYGDRVQYWERAKSALYGPKATVFTVPTDTAPQSWQQVNWQNFNTPVSKYFTVREVTNGDRRRLPSEDEIKANIFQLARELDIVREAWGSPIIVTSWYRPAAINRSVGGARNSQHLYGKGVDVRPARGNIHDFQRWLDTVAWADKALGYGAIKGFVHLDLRPGKIRWNY